MPKADLRRRVVHSLAHIRFNRTSTSSLPEGLLVEIFKSSGFIVRLTQTPYPTLELCPAENQGYYASKQNADDGDMEVEYP
ncbi:hypothetical protein IAQ61_005813 [Plenodomus lingam]|uniref:uncharacterized protein n=1 Tax=Leptosphaeria maculans TaxID=5022 RepID=UPI003326CFC8|nr:hypothetical protein IAQ61_005813 [Plenodomus lingam]